MLPKNKLSMLQAAKVMILAASKYRLAIIFAILGTICARIAEGAIYKYLLPKTLDSGIIERDPGFLTTMPYLIVGIFCALSIGMFLAKYCMAYIGRHVVQNYRVKILKHLLYLPHKFFLKNEKARIISKINYDTEQIAIAVTDAIREFLNSIIATIVLLIVMVSISWQATILLGVLIPVVVVLLKTAGKMMLRYSTNVQKTMGEMMQVSNEVISGASLIRNYGGQKIAGKSIDLAAAMNTKQELRTHFITSISSSIMQLISGVVLVAFIMLVNNNVIILTPGEIFGIIGAMFAIARPLKQMSEVNNVMQKGIAGLNSVNELLSESLEENLGTIICEQNIATSIEIFNLNFGYDKNLVLKNLSMQIAAGSTIGLVGSSGCGKSTLVNLLTRNFDVPTDSIFLNGIDINKYELASLRKNIAIVSQDTFVFNDSIANNIGYGGEYSQLEIINAAKEADAYDFIMELPNKFSTVLEENGNSLSGGQRQRIAIARAILRRAPLVIFDEATSALDNKSANIIKESINKLNYPCTKIIIAHRLNAISNADVIFVLEQGHVIESGTHDLLLSRRSEYAKLSNQN